MKKDLFFLMAAELHRFFRSCLASSISLNLRAFIQKLRQLNEVSKMNINPVTPNCFFLHARRISEETFINVLIEGRLDPPELIFVVRMLRYRIFNVLL